MTIQQILTFVFLGDGLLLVAVAQPMIRRAIPRNPIIGFKTPKTLSSDAIWYPANTYAGRQLQTAGLVIAGASLLLLLFADHVTKDQIGYAGMAIVLVPLIVAVYRSLRFLKTL